MQALKALVIFMGVLIIVGMGLVAYGIAVKFGAVTDNDEAPTAPEMMTATGQAWPEDVRVAIPPGARVAETTLGGGRMAVRLTLADGGETVLVFDLATGTRLGAVDLVPQGEPQ